MKRKYCCDCKWYKPTGQVTDLGESGECVGALARANAVCSHSIELNLKTMPTTPGNSYGGSCPDFRPIGTYDWRDYVISFLRGLIVRLSH